MRCKVHARATLLDELEFIGESSPIICEKRIEQKQKPVSNNQQKQFWITIRLLNERLHCILIVLASHQLAMADSPSVTQ